MDESWKKALIILEQNIKFTLFVTGTLKKVFYDEDSNRASCYVTVDPTIFFQYPHFAGWTEQMQKVLKSNQLIKIPFYMTDKGTFEILVSTKYNDSALVVMKDLYTPEGEWMEGSSIQMTLQFTTYVDYPKAGSTGVSCKFAAPPTLVTSSPNSVSTPASQGDEFFDDDFLLGN